MTDGPPLPTAQPTHPHTAEKKDKQNSSLAPLPPNDVWLDKEDVLLRMHISDRTLQNWRSQKLLPYSRIGKKLYYKESDLIKLLESNMVR